MAIFSETIALLIQAQTGGATQPLDNLAKSAKKTDDAFDKMGKKVGVTGATLKRGLVDLGSAALGAGLVVGIQKIVTGYTDAAKAAGDLAAATGGTVQEVSAMQAALQDAGISADTAASMLTKFTTVAGGAKGAQALADLNVELVKGKDGAVDYAATMVDAVDAITQLGDASERNRQLVALFGKQGAQAFQDLIASGASLSEAMAAIDTGRIFNETDVANAAAYDEAMDSLAASGQALGNTLGRTLVPAINGMLEIVVPLVGALGKIPPQFDAIAVAAGAVAGILLGSNPLGWALVAVGAVVALGGAMEADLNEQVSAATDRLAELEEQGLSTADALRQTAAEVEAQTGFWGNFWAAMRGSFDENADPLTPIRVAIDAMREGGRDVEFYGEQIGDTAAATEAAATATSKYAEAGRTLEEVLSDSASTQQEIADAVTLAGEAQAEKNRIDEAAKGIMAAYAASSYDAVNATLALFDAQFAAKDAQESLNEAIKKSGTNTDDVAKAALQAASAYAQLKEEQALLRGETFSATDANDALIKSLEKSLKVEGLSDKERARIQKMIDKLKEAQTVAGEGIKVNTALDTDTFYTDLGKIKTTIAEPVEVPMKLTPQQMKGFDKESYGLTLPKEGVVVPITTTGSAEAQRVIAGLADPGKYTIEYNTDVTNDQNTENVLKGLAKPDKYRIEYNAVVTNAQNTENVLRGLASPDYYRIEYNAVVTNAANTRRVLDGLRPAGASATATATQQAVPMVQNFSINVSGAGSPAVTAREIDRYIRRAGDRSKVSVTG